MLESPPHSIMLRPSEYVEEGFGQYVIIMLSVRKNGVIVVSLTVELMCVADILGGAVG